MADFSQWDFASDFSGVEAALLIAGITPLKLDFFDIKATPIYNRLKRDYTSLRDWYLEEIGTRSAQWDAAMKTDESLLCDEKIAAFEPFSSLPTDRQRLPIWLDSVATQKYSRISGFRDLAFFGYKFLKNNAMSGFEAQRFSRGGTRAMAARGKAVIFISVRTCMPK